MDESRDTFSSTSGPKAGWILAAILIGVGAAALFSWAKHRSHTETPATAEVESAPEPTLVELPKELAPVAARAKEMVATFETVARAQGFEGWPGLPEAPSSRLSDPLLSRFFTNPRVLILMGPEPGRVDALVLVKQAHPSNSDEPYLPILVRHLESKPTLHHPWGPQDKTPWGAPVTSSGDEGWGWVDGASLRKAEDGTKVPTYPGLMVVVNEPGLLWLAPPDTDEMSTWFYGFENRLSVVADDIEAPDGKPEHTAEEDIGEGLSTVSRADFDRAKLLGKVWKYAVFEVDGRSYAVLQENWDAWRQGPPSAPPVPMNAAPATPEEKKP